MLMMLEYGKPLAGKGTLRHPGIVAQISLVMSLNDTLNAC